MTKLDLTPTRPTCTEPEPLGLRRLLRERRRFGAYARLVQVTHEVRDGVYPALVRLQKLLEDEVAPAVQESADAEFAALLEQVRSLVASPARLMEALLGTLAQYRELLPDLYDSKAAPAANAEVGAAAAEGHEPAETDEVLPGPGYRAQ